jgi:hypothetical protein
VWSRLPERYVAAHELDVVNLPPFVSSEVRDRLRVRTEVAVDDPPATIILYERPVHVEGDELVFHIVTDIRFYARDIMAVGLRC